MDTIALLSHASPAAIVAYRSGLAVTAQQFLDDADQLARSLAERQARAECLHGSISFHGRTRRLPDLGARQPVALDAYAAGHCAACRLCPGRILLDGRSSRCDIELPQVYYPDQFARPAAAAVRPRRGSRCRTFRPPSSRPSYLRPARPARRCLTRKPGDCWRAACESGAPRLGLLDGRSHALVGTVPGQHMYGFESTRAARAVERQCLERRTAVLSGRHRAASRPVPRPRVLVTTPIHLRTLLTSEIELPPLDLVMSATAPLTREIWPARSKRNTVRRCWKFTAPPRQARLPCAAPRKRTAWRLWPGVQPERRERSGVRARRPRRAIDAPVRCHRDHRGRRSSCCMAGRPTWSMSPANAARSAT